MANLTFEEQLIETPGQLEHEHRDYWERFYASAAVAEVPLEPSPFARWVASREAAPGPLVDVGSGNGRDALWFARQGFETLGLDYAESAVHLASSAAQAEGLPASFARLNVYHPEEVTTAARRIAAEVAPSLVYARFFVHALEDDGRENLWSFTSSTLGTGGRAYFEFRVAETTHAFGEHYRHFVAPEVAVREIEAVGGTIEHLEEGHGLAPYKSEDPRVCRIVASW